MKKTLLIGTGCALLLSAASVAYSAQGAYVSANIGVAIASDADVTDSTLPGVTLNMESDTGWAGGIAAGYAYGNNIRVEGEVTYQRNDLDKLSLGAASLALTGDVSNTALLLNGYYDFANSSPWTPFISAGLGVAQVNINDLNVPGSGLPNTDDKDTVFAYQVGAGVSYAVSKEVSFDVKYRYFATSDPEFDTTSTEYSSHNIYAGIRVGL